MSHLRVFILLAVFLFFIVDVNAEYINSTNYRIDTPHISGGGNEANSTNYNNTAVIGSGVEGNASSSNFNNYLGFLSAMVKVKPPQPLIVAEEEAKKKSSSGGAGGGAGIPSKNISEIIPPNVVITPPELSISAISKKEEIRKLKLKNLGDIINFKIEIIGDDLKKVLRIEENEIQLEKDEEKEITLRFNATDKGLITGKIVFSSENYTREVLTVVNVRTENFLFDVSIIIPERYQLISSGQKIPVQINLLEVGVKQKVDVTATYVIKDFFGDIHLEESETFFVLGSKDFVKEFSTASLLPGKYIVGIELVYPGAFATSSAQFEIEEKVRKENVFTIILIVIAMAGVLVFISWLIKRRRNAARITQGLNL